MATVRFSKDLQERILASAKKKFEKSVEAARDARPDADLWSDRLWDAIFGQYSSAIATVPSEFINTAGSFTIKHGHRADGTVVTVGLQFEFKGTSKPWPVLGTGKVLAGVRKESTWSSAVILESSLADNPVVAQFLDEVDVWRNNWAAAQARQTEFVNSVKAVITSYSTLAPALKAWPPLWDLLGEDVKDRHREVVDREKRDPAAAISGSVDLDRLTALASLSKMGGA
jgi:hypothetical protein